jgi:hypothetical protein
LTKDFQLKIYPAIIAILGLSLVALLLSRVQIQIAPNRQSTDPILVNPEVPPAPDLSASPRPTITPSPSPVAETPVPAPGVNPSPPAAAVGSPGELRVSNQTNFPIRLALLYQQSTEGKAAKAFGQPVHWDFAPQEGVAKGLIMSLPSQKLQLQPGDVLIAFAQDGSRRYWGPYVVGQTPLPVWDAGQAEWQLVLQP